MKISQATKRIQQPIKIHVLDMVKHNFGECRRGLKLGHGYVLGNHPRDDIDGFKNKNIFFVVHLKIYIVVFLTLPST